jgi:hypothetical protein
MYCNWMIFRLNQPRKVPHARVSHWVTAIIIAVASVVLLEAFLQEPASKSFSTPGLRL